MFAPFYIPGVNHTPVRQGAHTDPDYVTNPEADVASQTGWPGRLCCLHHTRCLHRVRFEHLFLEPITITIRVIIPKMCAMLIFIIIISDYATWRMSQTSNI